MPKLIIENVLTQVVIDYYGQVDKFVYTETFTFSFVHYCFDSLGINLWPPFQACDGRLAQLVMTLAAIASLL